MWGTFPAQAPQVSTCNPLFYFFSFYGDVLLASWNEYCKKRRIFTRKELFNLHESALFSRLCMRNAKNQESYYKTCRMNQYYLCQRCNLSIHPGPSKQIPTIPKSAICKYIKNNFKMPFFSTLIMYIFWCVSWTGFGLQNEPQWIGEWFVNARTYNWSLYHRALRGFLLNLPD